VQLEQPAAFQIEDLVPSLGQTGRAP
jgi:hypothetical protein